MFEFYLKNLTLFSGVINQTVTDYSTFKHVKSIFPDEWYNFIVPTVPSHDLEFTKVQQILDSEASAGVKTSYYINQEFFTDYNTFLKGKGLSEIGNDVYMVKELTEVLPVRTNEQIQELTSLNLEEYLTLSAQCFPEWSNNRSYCEHFFDLSQQNQLENKILKTFVMFSDGKIVAFSSIIIDTQVGLAYLHNSGTHPDYRKQGYHKEMVNFRCNYALQKGVYNIYAIVEDLSNSFNNFKSMGFEQKDKFYLFF